MRAILSLCAAILLGAYATPSYAAPEPPIRQAPGYFRIAVGDFMVTALQDGIINLGTDSYQGLPA